MMERVISIKSLYQLSEEDLLIQDSSLESLKEFTDAIGLKVKEAIRKAIFEWRCVNSDYVQSGLAEFVKPSSKKIELYLSKSFTDKEIFVTPDGMKGSYKDFTKDLKDLLVSIPFERVLTDCQNTLFKLKEKIPVYTTYGNTHVTYLLDKELKDIKEQLADYTKSIKDFTKDHLSSPVSRPKKAKDVFKSKDDLKETIDNCLSFDFYQKTFVHLQDKIKAFEGRVEGMVKSGLDYKGLPKGFKQQVGDLLVSMAMFFESYAVLIHETIRVSHNLTVSLKKAIG